MQGVILRPICVDDTDNIVRWRNSGQVKQFLFHKAILRQKVILRIIGNMLKRENANNTLLKQKTLTWILEQYLLRILMNTIEKQSLE